jgi:hypothetical protein
MGKAVKAITAPMSSGTVGNILGTSPASAGGIYDPNTAAFADTKAQQDFTNRLLVQTQGTGPSLAQQQLKTATDRNVAQQIAMAASNRGNPALVQREVMKNQAAAGQEMAGQSALIRSQEMMSAQDAYNADLIRQQENQKAIEAMKAGQYMDQQNRYAASQGQAQAAKTSIVTAAIGKK